MRLEVVSRISWDVIEAGIEAATLNLQNPAHRCHRIFAEPGLYERVPRFDSLAKYAAAFFRMSRSSRHPPQLSLQLPQLLLLSVDHLMLATLITVALDPVAPGSYW